MSRWSRWPGPVLHPRTGRSVAAAAVASGLLASPLAACGAQQHRPADAVAGTGATDCRAQWRHLADSVAGRDQQVDPSDQADRWTAVLATAQCYLTSATGQDCGAPLAQAQDTVRQIQDWSAQLRTYDIPYRFAALAPVATDYLLAPLPTPQASSSPTSARQKSGRRPPTKNQVQAALTTLQDTATVATSDMQAGWQEATTVDLGDAAAVRRSLQDLAFLAQDSTPYQACLAALGVLERARTSRS